MFVYRRHGHFSWTKSVTSCPVKSLVSSSSGRLRAARGEEFAGRDGILRDLDIYIHLSASRPVPKYTSFSYSISLLQSTKIALPPSLTAGMLEKALVLFSLHIHKPS